MLISLRSRALLRPACQPLYQYQQQPFSFFGGIFGKKKEEAKPAKVEKKEIVVEVEPAKYHKESVDAASKEEDAVDIKAQIRTLDRTGPNNLFGKYQRQRKTLKERNSNLEEHLSPELAANERVSIQKFENNFFKRGLDQDEKPFPISPKVGPYLVEKPIFGAKNYYWCSCGMSKEQVIHCHSFLIAILRFFSQRVYVQALKIQSGREKRKTASLRLQIDETGTLL